MVDLLGCDICDIDGETTLAVAKYIDNEGDTWVICKKHLAHVKEAKLKYWMLNEDEDSE